ncbi:MAG TPA: aminodeoxychorismate lyase [Acidiferrobacter sp.]|nr:aminodeoxychorismate lyase [Acidiferrobacter sp.]
MCCLINGRPDERVGVANRGLQYGDGLFETIAIQDGRLLLWSQHLDRLAIGASRLGLAAINRALLTAEATELAVGIQLGILKLMLVREASGRGYRPSSQEVDRILALWPWPARGVSAEGVDVMWCRTRLARQPQLAGIKHLNRLEQVLGQQELGSGHGEGLMQDTDGWVIAGTMSNVFLGERGALITPSLDYAGVAGVMRARVMDCAADLGIRVTIDGITRAHVLRADEIFLTNSVLGVCAVRSLPEREYGRGPIAQRIHEAIRACGDAAVS